MSAIQALRNADLTRALQDLQNEVRRAPAEPKHRIFLFQLLAVLGQWDRALTQLNVARDMNADAMMMAQTYQELLSCEALRHDVFRGVRTPLWFGEPEPWMAQIWEARRLAADGAYEAADQLRTSAFEQVPARPGAIEFHEPKVAPEAPVVPAHPPARFAWFADADLRLGPVLEVIVNGRYYWVPMHRIRRIDFEPATDLRDLVWLPAHFEWINGGEMVGFIPTRYPGSEASGDDLIRLARKTEWLESSPGFFTGLGQRLFTTDADEYGLLALKRLTFEGGIGAGFEAT